MNIIKDFGVVTNPKILCRLRPKPFWEKLIQWRWFGYEHQLGVAICRRIVMRLQIPKRPRFFLRPRIRALDYWNKVGFWIGRTEYQWQWPGWLRDTCWKLKCWKMKWKIRKA